MSVTMRSVNRSTWPDAFKTTSGVTAGHSTFEAMGLSVPHKMIYDDVQVVCTNYKEEVAVHEQRF